jgi:hypothetical protein
MATSQFDIVIFGASFGDVSAALAAARYGKCVVLADDAANVEGQATAKAVTRCDEALKTQSPNTNGSSKSYQLLKDDIRVWYRTNATLAPVVNPAKFNPGFSQGIHPFSADCNVTKTVLRQLLKAVEANVTVMFGTPVASTTTSAGQITGLVLGNGDVLSATTFIDATDLGLVMRRFPPGFDQAGISK